MSEGTACNTLVINNLFVDKNYRKQGIAHKLIEMIEDWATKKEYSQIETTVYTPNTDAQSILNQFHIQQVFEVRKKIVNRQKYDEIREKELIEYYSRMRKR
jgi:GNAT superfamily N-acetyltransferase